MCKLVVFVLAYLLAVVIAEKGTTPDCFNCCSSFQLKSVQYKCMRDCRIKISGFKRNNITCKKTIHLVERDHFSRRRFFTDSERILPNINWKKVSQRSKELATKAYEYGKRVFGKLDKCTVCKLGCNFISENKRKEQILCSIGCEVVCAAYKNS